MARDARLREVASGVLSASDVCDAHPELIRVARNHGDPAGSDCPLCGEAELVHVTYVFGPRLPAHGRCIISVKDMDRIRRRKGTYTGYRVEVCVECRWNHLDRSFPVT